MLRRRHLMALLAAPALLPRTTIAQAFPQRPIRLIAPFGAGSTVDLMGRALAPLLAQDLGQPVVVENRAGAGGNIGVDVVAKAAPDGHTLGIGTSGPLAINPAMLAQMPYQVADLAPVSLIAVGPNALVVGNDVPARDLGELVALARARPGQLNYGSPGVGSTGHLAGELFAAAAGITLTHVPYRGNAEAMNDLLSGQLHMLFSGLPPVLPLHQARRVRVFAIAGPSRMPALADVPTLAEAGVRDAESIAFYGIIAPRGTPTPVIQRVAAAVRHAVGTPQIQETFRNLGSEPGASTPEAFAEMIASEGRKWRAVIERLNLRQG